MNIKSLLLGSAAALVAVSGARAADAIVAAEPEPVEYVRVCDAFGTGYFYIPGTETCLRVHGYIRYDIAGGELFEHTSATGDGTYSKNARLSFRLSTASETELGTLRTYSEVRFNWGDAQLSDRLTLAINAAGDPVAFVDNGYENSSSFSLNFAWIQLGGLRICKDDSYFTTFTGYAGSVIKDGSYGPFDTNLISYTYSAGAFTAGISLEQGDDNYERATIDLNTGAVTAAHVGWGIDDYMPHVVVGLGYNAGMVNIRGVVGYDTRNDYISTITGNTYDLGGWAAKLRADVTINDSASVFAMLMYGENSSAYTTWSNGVAGDETFSVIAGGSVALSDKATFNIQGQWIDGAAGVDDFYSVAANVAYELVPGLTITPEVVYADDGTNGEFGGFLRVQRSF